MRLTSEIPQVIQGVLDRAARDQVLISDQHLLPFRIE